MYSIYEIKNLVTGFTYIGYSENVQARWKEHHRHLEQNKHHNIHLQRAWNKYGKKSFEWKILKSYEDKKSAILLEIELIEASQKVYNIAAGGIGGNWSKNLSEERMKEISQTFSKSRQERYKDPLERAKCNSFLNLTEEERLERVKIWSEVKLGSKNSNYKYSLPVLQIDKKTGQIIKEWTDVSEAGRSGFERRYILACCKKRKGYNSHKGYIWQWKE